MGCVVVRQSRAQRMLSTVVQMVELLVRLAVSRGTLSDTINAVDLLLNTVPDCKLPVGIYPQHGVAVPC